MTHRDAGNYSAKHASDCRYNKEIAHAIEKSTVEGEIACAEASRVASELNVSMGQVGTTIDLREIRITKCQLGLFGYGPKKMMIKPAETVSSELEKSIRDALVDGRLSCVASWEIAEKFYMPKMSIAFACEALKIKIKPCQLGAF
jgi:hypothetical protein